MGFAYRITFCSPLSSSYEGLSIAGKSPHEFSSEGHMASQRSFFRLGREKLSRKDFFIIRYSKLDFFYGDLFQRLIKKVSIVLPML